MEDRLGYSSEFLWEIQQDLPTEGRLGCYSGF